MFRRSFFVRPDVSTEQFISSVDAGFVRVQFPSWRPRRSGTFWRNGTPPCGASAPSCCGSTRPGFAQSQTRSSLPIKCIPAKLTRYSAKKGFEKNVGIHPNTTKPRKQKQARVHKGRLLFFPGRTYLGSICHTHDHNHNHSLPQICSRKRGILGKGNHPTSTTPTLKHKLSRAHKMSSLSF